MGWQTRTLESHHRTKDKCVRCEQRYEFSAFFRPRKSERPRLFWVRLLFIDLNFCILADARVSAFKEIGATGFEPVILR